MYASDLYKKPLKTCGAYANMSKKGDCWDNAVAESFSHTLKIELIHHCDFETHDESRGVIFEYIEVFTIVSVYIPLTDMRLRCFLR